MASGLVPTRARAGVTFTNLFAFSGTNGANPSAGLVQGSDGSLYGTTTSGGTNGFGAVFRITTNGTLTPLISFNNSNGATPFYGRLVLGRDGLLYGTTSEGGTNGYGTVFAMSTNGGLTPLFSFDSTNGAEPRGGLLLGGDGNFYGTTASGGTNGVGTVFRIATNGALAPLAAFDTNGFTPYAGLVQCSNGSFYGTTYQGGTNGNGTVFQVTTNGTLASVHAFDGTNDGGNPYASLIQGADGNLYGTAFYGGAYGFGTVFKLVLGGAFSVFATFNGTNGASPQAPLLQGTDGNFYGTTQNGGAYTNQYGTGYGTVFRLTTNGLLSTLVSFNGTNGAFPRGGLLQATDGSFYGTTTYGGTNDNGTVFRITITAPPPPPVFQSVTQAGSTLTLTWSASVGEIYQMQFKTNLNETNWSPFGSLITATNGVMTTLESIGPDPQRIYRVALMP